MTIKRKKTVTAYPLSSKRPRKLGIYMQNTEYYSPEDLADIHEGLEQAKRGETISLEEFCRREKL